MFINSTKDHPIVFPFLLGIHFHFDSIQLNTIFTVLLVSLGRKLNLRVRKLVMLVLVLYYLDCLLQLVFYNARDVTDAYSFSPLAQIVVFICEFVTYLGLVLSLWGVRLELVLRGLLLIFWLIDRLK